MIKLKKSKKKIWIYSLVTLALLGGGAFFILSRTSVFTGSWNVLSKCSFDPAVSEKNKQLIEETITTVAHEGVFSLLGKEGHLRDMGAVLSRELPDLTYWAYILKNPKLKSDMKKIQSSSAKYNGFVEGTRDRLMREYHENPCLLQQAKGFAKYVGLPEEETANLLQECIDNDSKDEDAFKKFLDFILGGEESSKS